jgi:TM2 domain-containing membrane protein YozV
MGYYYSDGVNQWGPTEVSDLKARGVRGDMLVWREGMEKWERADSVQEVRAVLGIAPAGTAGAAPPVQPVAQVGYGAYSARGHPMASEVSGKKIAAGICAILVGTFGVHKFVLGMTGAGLTMLLITLLTCFMAAPIMHVIGIIGGVMYLTKSEAEFYQVYMVGKKAWF